MRIHLLTVLLLLILKSATAQEYTVPKTEDLVKIPPSPEAQAFAKYGTTPVNLHSGVADISIPLYTVQGREFSVPITLTYDASGVKVDQTATWAGLGWNLSVGGMITRQVRGKPDDFLTSNPGYTPFYAPTLWPDYQFVRDFSGTGTGADYVRYYQFVQKSLKTIDQGNDMEISPDVYSISAPGLSGTLYINYGSMIAYSMDHPEWKVELVLAFGATPGNKIIEQWRITDESGNLFVFDFPEVTYVDEHNSYDGAYSYNSAWGLTRIESKNQRDIIQFDLGVAEWTQPRLAGRSAYRLDYLSNNSDCGGDKLEEPVNEPTYRINQVEFSGITLNGKPILGIETKSRMDLAGKGAIKSIQITDQDGLLVKKFKFIHSYFGTPSPTDEDASKLRLDRLEIFGSDTTAVPQQYAFQYYNPSGLFPSRKSFAQDYWGYYNGAISNTSLIPYNYEYDAANMINFGWKGSDRRPNLGEARMGALQSIQYPTGGKTTFEYEAHRTVDVAWRAEFPTYITNFGGPGGTQTENQFNYTDDVASPTPGFPIGQSGGFNVPLTGKYEIKVSATTTPELYVPGWAFAIIYRTGDIDCDGNGNCNYGEYQDFQQLTAPGVWAEAEWFFYGGLGFSNSWTVPINLEAGAYRFLFLNTDSHSSLQAEITSVVTTESHEAGGLRIAAIADLDETGSEVSRRVFYYGDLSLVPNESVGEALATAGEMNSGQLHLYPTYEKQIEAERFNPFQNGPADLLTCWRATRFSSNRGSADQTVTYPVVTEVQLDRNGNTNGFVVTEFNTGVGASGEGYVKSSPINGKPARKRTYNAESQLLVEESNYYSVRVAEAAGTGESVGFYFYHLNNKKVDLYVKTALFTPFNTFTQYQTATTAFDAGAEANNSAFGSYSEVTCWDSGLSTQVFNSLQEALDGWTALYNQGKNPNPYQYSENPCCNWIVSWQSHTVHGCYNLGGEVAVSSYLFPRRWATTDSTRTTEYLPGGNKISVRKSFYESTNHYQVTRVEQKDSKGTLHKIEFKYPHEMQSAEPSNSIWGSLLTAHRIAEQIQITATYGSNSPDFKQKTVYKSVSNGTYTMYLPDTIKISSGTGPLEGRVRYHQYDAVGNPVELSRINDVGAVYLWGYNNSYTVATITNAKANEVFFNSFEYTPDLGNSSDAHTGLKSKTGGYAKSLTGLTPNKAYVLTYWKKPVNGAWSLQTVNIAASSATTYDISITGQVDDRFDDVRFYPAGALMTTYTHRPGKGMTSATDPNNVVQQFEYDDHGRLHIVRDYLGNILKQVNYHYRTP